MDCKALGSTPSGGRELSFLLLLILPMFVEIMIQVVSLFNYINFTDQEIEMFRDKETDPS